jgi:hypothetical protein
MHVNTMWLQSTHIFCRTLNSQCMHAFEFLEILKSLHFAHTYVYKYIYVSAHIYTKINIYATLIKFHPFHKKNLNNMRCINAA